jgi:hypothetical protein
VGNMSAIMEKLGTGIVLVLFLYHVRNSLCSSSSILIVAEYHFEILIHLDLSTLHDYLIKVPKIIYPVKF